MNNTLDSSWKEWIATNIERGCDRLELAEILLKNDFSPDVVSKHLGVKLVTRTLAEKPIKGELNTVSAAVTESRRMELTEADVEKGVYIPFAKKVAIKKKSFELYSYEHFVSETERVELVNLISNQLGIDANGIVKGGCSLDDIKDSAAEELDRRICALMGINPSYALPTEVTWCHGNDVRQEKAEESEIGWTFVLYLNSCFDGGGLRFDKIKEVFPCQAGQAVIWNTRDSSGAVNPYSAASPLPITKGFEIKLTTRFLTKGKGEIFSKVPNEYLPAYTPDGFIKTRAPEVLISKLQDYYIANESEAKDERVEGFIFGKTDTKHPPSELIELPDVLKAETHQTLKPYVEAWFGHFVEVSFVFGIRRYLNGAELLPHRDRGKTHIVGCIINVSQDVEQPWPLLMEDHQYRRHNILLEPGDMVFYESARLLHGRPETFKGKEFSNVFVHFKLEE